MLCAITDRQRAAAFESLSRVMQVLLQHIDPDYYRSALLLIVRTELEQLRATRSALDDAKRQSKIPRRAAYSAGSFVQSFVPRDIVQSCSLEVDDTG
jgi:hypothetical protein